MSKLQIFIVSVLVVVITSSITIITMAKEIVGSAPGIPACQELNDKMPWTVQSYLYQQCEEYGVDYCFALAVIEMESQFNEKAYNSKSIDRGLMQVNRQWVSMFKKNGWINSSEDLYEPKTNIRCGMFLLGYSVSLYGNTERAYAYYNTGNPNVKSNKASRKVMEYWEEWRERFETK